MIERVKGEGLEHQMRDIINSNPLLVFRRLKSSQQSNAEPILGEDDSLSFLSSQEVTPITSFTQPTK